MMAGLLYMLVGFGLGCLAATGLFWRIVAKAMDDQDPRDWTGEYGPPTIPARSTT